jgi:hypothetical protein
MGTGDMEGMHEHMMGEEGAHHATMEGMGSMSGAMTELHRHHDAMDTMLEGM